MDQELAPHGCVRPISANQTRTTSTCASILPRVTPCGASQGNRWFHDQLPASVDLKPLRPVFPPVRRVGSDLGCPVAGRPGRRTQGDDAGTPGLGRFPPIRVNVIDAPRPRTPRAVEGPSSGPPPASLGRAAGLRSAFRRRAHPSSPARPLHAPEWCRCASWGRVLPLRRRCKEQRRAGSITREHRTSLIPNTRIFRFGIRIRKRIRRGEPSARPTGVGCRVSGALGSGCTPRSILSPSFAHTEHPSVTAGRASGLEPRPLLPAT